MKLKKNTYIEAGVVSGLISAFVWFLIFVILKLDKSSVDSIVDVFFLVLRDYVDLHIIFPLFFGLLTGIVLSFLDRGISFFSRIKKIFLFLSCHYFALFLPYIFLAILGILFALLLVPNPPHN